MFSLGGTELLLIAVVALLLFGPDKLPQIARTVGRFMREFNKYRDIMESTLRTEIYAAESKTSEAPSRSRRRLRAPTRTPSPDESMKPTPSSETTSRVHPPSMASMSRSRRPGEV